MERAVRLMAERTTAYGLVWKQYGALSNLLSAARKIDRLMNIWWFATEDQPPALHKDALDDAMDAINYLGFFIQNAREGNILGTAPKRPDLKLIKGPGIEVKKIDG